MHPIVHFYDRFLANLFKKNLGSSPLRSICLKVPRCPRLGQIPYTHYFFLLFNLCCIYFCLLRLTVETISLVICEVQNDSWCTHTDTHRGAAERRPRRDARPLHTGTSIPLLRLSSFTTLARFHPERTNGPRV